MPRHLCWRLALLPLAASFVACAASPGQPAATGDTTTSAPEATPAAKCLAIAAASHDKKPDEPAEIGVRHVLVKYKGAKNAADTIGRSREEACLRAMEARDKILAGEDFTQVVEQYSDENGAASRAGSLGRVGRKDVAPAFGDAAFELSIGQMSDLVETDFGFHLILRTE